MRLKLHSLVVTKYRSGQRENEYRPFTLPEGAVIVSIATVMNVAIVYYTTPA